MDDLIVILCTLGAVALMIVLLVVFFLLDRSQKKRQGELNVAVWKEEASQRKAEALRTRQLFLAGELAEVIRQTLDDVEAMPMHIESAEMSLDEAELRFRDRAFAPFWDSIESTVSELGSYFRRIEEVRQLQTNYMLFASQIPAAAPPFPIDGDFVLESNVALATSTRLNSIVYQAQRDFQFATIYEQRKTNQVLVAGFESLAAALSTLGDRICTSMDSLHASVGIMRLEMNASFRSLSGELARYNQLNSAQQRTVLASLRRASTERKALALISLASWENSR